MDNKLEYEIYTGETDVSGDRAADDTLAGRLHNVIDRWVAATAPRLRDELDFAVIKIIIDQPGGDDDGTLHVDFRVEEETSFTSDKYNSGGGRVPGVKF